MCFLLIAGPQQQISSKLEALYANRLLVAGTSFAMNEHDFEKAKLDIMTATYSS